MTYLEMLDFVEDDINERFEGLKVQSVIGRFGEAIQENERTDVLDQYYMNCEGMETLVTLYTLKEDK